MIRKYILALFLVAPLWSSTYSVFNGESIKIDYSQDGITLLKLSGGALKETVNFQTFEQHTTSDAQSVFISRITDPSKAVFLVFENGHTIGVEFDKPRPQGHVTHHIALAKIDTHPEFLANSILEGKRFAGFKESLLSESYQTESFWINNKILFSNGDIEAQLIEITNRKNSVKNLNDLSKKTDIIGFSSEKLTLQPGESTYAVFVRKT